MTKGEVNEDNIKRQKKADKKAKADKTEAADCMGHEWHKKYDILQSFSIAPRDESEISHEGIAGMIEEVEEYFIDWTKEVWRACFRVMQRMQ